MDKDSLLNIHSRLLDGNPTASAEIAELALGPLTEGLKREFPRLEESLITDAVEDAILSYLKMPNSFNPMKKTLLGYLKMSARGDLLNALHVQKGRREREKLTKNVEDQLDGRNRYSGKIEPDIGGRIDGDELRRKVQAAFSDPTDQKLLNLIQNGVRATSDYAAALDIATLPVTEQRRVAKRHKDRILKRLSRLRSTIHE